MVTARTDVFVWRGAQHVGSVPVCCGRGWLPRTAKPWQQTADKVRAYGHSMLLPLCCPSKWRIRIVRMSRSIPCTSLAGVDTLSHGVAIPEAVDVLTGALERLDPTFIRAETALRVDLAIALNTIDEPSEARTQARRARQLAIQIGSTRQQCRMKSLSAIPETPSNKSTAIRPVPASDLGILR
jgi:hypothetical protein